MSTMTNMLQPGSLPTSSLRLALESRLGPDEAARVLQEVGEQLADHLYARLISELQAETESTDHDPASLEESEFWDRLGQILAGLGWGSLNFSVAHEGVGILESSDWGEADPASAALRPSCHTTAALIANLMGRIADGEIGVLEVECRSRGDLECRFAFGGRLALSNVYGVILNGGSLEDLVGDLS